MKVCIYSRALEAAQKRLEETLRESKIPYTVLRSLDAEPSGYDMLVVLGGDRDVLSTFHALTSTDLPVLGVSESNEPGFLTTVGVDEFGGALKGILAGEHSVEDATRLSVRADGKGLPNALNEVAVFSKRSATLVEYVMNVDGETVWRDYSDGVIISTPTGSTAYSMSAGGPMVLKTAPVFSIVSVSSLDVTRRPLIVPDTSLIEIDEISSVKGCEVILDGLVRSAVKDRIEVRRAEVPARLVRLPETGRPMERIAKKVKLAEELLKMPPSAKLILKTLEYEGPMTQKELSAKTLLPDRTTRLAISTLLAKGLVRKKRLLRDARRGTYEIVQ